MPMSWRAESTARSKSIQSNICLANMRSMNYIDGIRQRTVGRVRRSGRVAATWLLHPFGTVHTTSDRASVHASPSSSQGVTT